MSNTVKLIAAREIREKLRDRGFILFTIAVLSIMLGGGVVGVLFSGSGTKQYDVGIVGGDFASVASAVRALAPAFGAEVTLQPLPNIATAKQAVKQGDVDAAVTGEGILVVGDVSNRLQALLQSSVRIVRALEGLLDANVSSGELQAALAAEPLSVRKLKRPEDTSAIRQIIVLIGIALLFVTLYLYGFWISSGVVEEKSSRVVEVVLSAVRPSELLAGKVIGIGSLAVTQIAGISVVGLVVAVVLGLNVSATMLGTIALVFVWFILGYAFYSGLFAVAGSVISRQEDLQYTQLPLMLVIFAGYGVALAQIGSSGSLVARVLSFMPPFAPMLVPMRVGFGEPATWEIALPALITLVSTVGAMWVAARLYSGSVLRFGSRVRLRTAWKAVSK